MSQNRRLVQEFSLLFAPLGMVKKIKVRAFYQGSSSDVWFSKDYEHSECLEEAERGSVSNFVSALNS